MIRETITYNGKKYQLVRLQIKDKTIYPNGISVLLAPESLSDAFTIKNGDEDPYPSGSEESEIDDKIYHYVPDDILSNSTGNDIAKNYLDTIFSYVPSINFEVGDIVFDKNTRQVGVIVEPYDGAFFDWEVLAIDKPFRHGHVWQDCFKEEQLELYIWGTNSPEYETKLKKISFPRKI